MARPPYVVEIVRKAQKELKRLPKEVQMRLREAIRDLANDPRPSGVKKLRGETTEKGEPLYRIRVGNYRVIYAIKDQRLVVLIIRIRHRSDAY